MVMTLASHARGPEFDPRQLYFFLVVGFVPESGLSVGVFLCVGGAK